MGCDIHAYVERIEHFDSGNSYTCGTEVYFGRNYMMFGVLAGVRYQPREQVAPTRGVPDFDSLSWFVRDEYYLTVLSQREYNKCCRAWDSGGKVCSLKQAKQWGDKWVKKEKWPNEKGKPTKCFGKVEHPDWHSASWLTLEEVERARQLYHEERKAEVEYYKEEESEAQEEIKQPTDLDKLVVKAQEKGYLYKAEEPEEEIKEEPEEEMYRDCDLEAVYALMKSYKENGFETRFVFWFDN